MLKVNEIFLSIQGESTFAGYPCLFVRLSGCNLSCSYCDTLYAREHYTLMNVDKIISICQGYDVRLVEITGGEPLIQPETPHLAKAFLEMGYTVLLETNGSQDIGVLDFGVRRIVDIKCPTSGESHKNLWKNLDLLKEGDEIKFVLQEREDYEYALEVIKSFDLMKKGVPIHFSPVLSALRPSTLAQWILRDQLQVRLHLQLHKIIWPEGEPKIQNGKTQ